MIRYFERPGIKRFHRFHLQCLFVKIEHHRELYRSVFVWLLLLSFSGRKNLTDSYTKIIHERYSDSNSFLGTS